MSLQNDQPNYAPLDAMTVATMLWPKMIQQTSETNVEAVHDGAARGSVLVDWKRIKSDPKPYNARIVKAIDYNMFMDSMVYYLTCEQVAC